MIKIEERTADEEIIAAWNEMVRALKKYRAQTVGRAKTQAVRERDIPTNWRLYTTSAELGAYETACGALELAGEET